MQRNKWIGGLLALMMILQVCTCAYAGERYVWAYQGDVAYFEENGLIGLLDRQGNVLIEPQFTEVSPFYFELAEVKKGNLIGVISKAGDILVEPADYERLNYGNFGDDRHNPVITYTDSQGQHGTISMAGERIPETRWDYPAVFRNGVAIVTKNKEDNLLNLSDEFLLEQWWYYIERVPVQETQGNPFFIVHQESKGKRGVVNARGEWIVPLDEWGWVFATDNSLFLVEKEGKWGGADYTGNMVIPLEWDGLRDANEGLIWARKDGKQGYINLRGEIVIPLEWDEAFPFNHGLSKVRKGKQQGIIDATGAFVIPLQTTYSFADKINDAGYIVYSRGKNWGFMDLEGNVLSSVNYRTYSTEAWATEVDNKAWPYFNVLLYDGFCQVIDNRDRSNLMDVNGNMLFPKFIKARIVHFRYGLGFLSEDLGNYSLINTKGEHLTDAIWSTARDFRQFGDQLIAEVRYNPTGRPGDGVQGYINEWGEPIVGIKLPKAE